MAKKIDSTWIDEEMTTDAELAAAVSAIDARLIELEDNSPDPDFKFINEKNDLPAPVNGVITLAAGVTYFITKTIDLTGDRLVAGNNTVLIGGSSENCFLISTGLSASTALITSNYSLPMRNLSITHGTALNLDATGNPTAALDWFGVNFTNSSVGTIRSYSNVILSDCALLNSYGMTFDGTIGTVGFINCLFSGIAAQTTLNFPSTLTITRRIRAIYSSFVAFGGATAINVDVNAVIPVESYILDTVNLSGGSPNYLTGVTYTDNKAFFSNCKGVVNSSEIGQAYYTNNTVQNGIATQNVFEKIEGVTTASPINQKFSHTNNRLTYTGGLARSFKVTAAISANSVTTQSIIIKTRVAKNGTTIAESESQATTSATGRNENFFSQAIVELNTNDFIEIFIANESNANSVLVTELNFIVEALN
jgi:hypothetical protein